MTTSNPKSKNQKPEILTTCPPQEELTSKLERIEDIKYQMTEVATSFIQTADNNNCTNIINCNDCNDSLSLINCAACDYCASCVNCISCTVCISCIDCNNCLLCVHLTNKTQGYWLLNREVTQEVFEEAVAILSAYVDSREEEYQEAVANGEIVERPATLEEIETGEVVETIMPETPKTIH